MIENAIWNRKETQGGSESFELVLRNLYLFWCTCVAFWSRIDGMYRLKGTATILGDEATLSQHWILCQVKFLSHDGFVSLKLLDSDFTMIVFGGKYIPRLMRWFSLSLTLTKWILHNQTKKKQSQSEQTMIFSIFSYFQKVRDAKHSSFVFLLKHGFVAILSSKTDYLIDVS